jgi:NAD(P)-dependent dehydrogenase (short-subunit alcohol dehydrogenase family)
MATGSNVRAVVTGAGGGLGREIVASLQGAGMSVAACDSDPALLAAVSTQHRYRFDLRDGNLAEVAAKITAECGVPDVLINNAGYTRAETMANIAAAWDAELDINLNGVVRFTQGFLPAMVARGRGNILFISSINALAHFGNPAYAAAKAGMLAYMRAIAVEYGRHGLRANAVCPGSVRTGAWDHRELTEPGIAKRAAALYPMGRMVSSQEVAQAVLFLASEASSGITGVALPVDAGITAGNLTFIQQILEKPEQR